MIESEARLGEVRLVDLQSEYGDDIRSMDRATVLVLGRPGELGAVTTVRLGWYDTGRGPHRGLECPRCGAQKRLLRTDGEGGLRCIDCLRVRTRQQREKRTKAYRKFGGRQEDQLLRLLTKPSPATPGAIARAEEFIGELVAGDRARLAEVHARLTLAGVR